MYTSRNTMALDENHDIYLDENGHIARVYDSDAVLQNVRCRLLFVFEEWFLNLAGGLPWFTEMTGHNPNLFKIRTYIARQIIATDGVVSLKSLVLDFDKPNRKLNVTFEYVDDYGNTVPGSV